MRRWAWGASDIAYVVDKAFFKKNKIPFRDKVFKLLRLLEGHTSWATAPLILLFAARVPAFFDRNNISANQLPVIASRIQTIAILGVLVTMFISFKVLPPKPERYKRRRTLFMVVQWIMLPITSICFSASAALYSQTRLMLGKYLDRFDATKKAVKTADNKSML